MSLNKVEKELYKKDFPKDFIEHDASEFDPEKIDLNNLKEKAEKEEWGKEKNVLDEKEKRIIKKGEIALVAIALLVVGVVAWAINEKTRFSEQRVTVSINSEEKVQSGKLMDYEILYENKNRADLENAFLRITYPEKFQMKENNDFIKESSTTGMFKLGDLKSNSSGKIVFSGKVFSPKGSFVFFKADLLYQPTDIRSRFEANAQKNISIFSAPVMLEVVTQKNVPRGGEVKYEISYKNNGEEVIDNLSVKIDYPEQFIFLNSIPESSEDNKFWHIGDLVSGQSGKIIVIGTLTGKIDEIKTARIYAGVLDEGDFVSYNEESTVSKVVASSLEIKQTVNNAEEILVNAGEGLGFVLKYKNVGNLGLRDVIVMKQFDDPLLDYNTLKFSGGKFDSDSKTITWTAADYGELRNLQPGQGGEISFNINVKDILPINDVKDKNFTISGGLARIDSPDVPNYLYANKVISSNNVKMKVRTKLVFETKGYYNDTSIPNFGPIPPKVGEETSYTIHWKVYNISNDVSEVRVTSSIPTYAELTGKFFPENAIIEYNERNKSVVWTIGNISAGTGVISPPLEVSFQVKVKPFMQQVGSDISIIGGSFLTARDNFTNEVLEKWNTGKNTELNDDPTVADRGRVVN